MLPEKQLWVTAGHLWLTIYYVNIADYKHFAINLTSAERCSFTPESIVQADASCLSNKHEARVAAVCGGVPNASAGSPDVTVRWRIQAATVMDWTEDHFLVKNHH